MRENRLTLIKAGLDVLVFADMLSEPMSYFLGFSRFAPVQVCFWGNPLTAGRKSIDYFVADRMEHPYRTLAGDEWSEQVVLWTARASGIEGLLFLKDCPLPIAMRLSRGKRWAYLKATGRCYSVPSRSSSCTPLRYCNKKDPGSDDQRKGVVFTAGRRQAWTKGQWHG